MVTREDLSRNWEKINWKISGLKFWAIKKFHSLGISIKKRDAHWPPTKKDWCSALFLLQYSMTNREIDHLTNGRSILGNPDVGLTYSAHINESWATSITGQLQIWSIQFACEPDVKTEHAELINFGTHRSSIYHRPGLSGLWVKILTEKIRSKTASWNDLTLYRNQLDRLFSIKNSTMDRLMSHFYSKKKKHINSAQSYDIYFDETKTGHPNILLIWYDR